MRARPDRPQLTIVTVLCSDGSRTMQMLELAMSNFKTEILVGDIFKP